MGDTGNTWGNGGEEENINEILKNMGVLPWLFVCRFMCASLWAPSGDFVDVVFYCFAGYYCTCLGANFYFYYRRGAEKPC